MTQKSNSHQMLLGAILGAIVVGSAAAFLSSKTGQDFKDNSVDKLRDLKSRLDEFLEDLGEKTEYFTNDVSEKKSEYSDKIQDFVGQVSDHMKSYATEENKQIVTALLIGAVVGGLIGAGTGSLMSPNSQRNGGVFRNIGSRVSSLKSTFDDLLENVEGKSQSFMNSAKKTSTKDVLEFVGAGLALWNKMQSKR